MNGLTISDSINSYKYLKVPVELSFYPKTPFLEDFISTHGQTENSFSRK